jgi:hypothetical protein
MKADFSHLYDKFAVQMTAEPSPSAEVKKVNLEVVRDGTPRPRGRPVILTPRLFVKICHAIEKGTATSMACKVHQVTYSHFRFRVARSPLLEERLKKAEDVRFALRHDFALAAIIEAGKKSWMAYAWYLERVLPGHYALRRVDREIDSAEQRSIGEAIPAER